MRRRTWILTFLATAVAGLMLWVLASPGLLQRLGYAPMGGMFFLSDYEIPVLAAVAVVAGLVSPGGFWLWGIAAVSLRLVANLASSLYVASSERFPGQFLAPLDVREISVIVLLEIVIHLLIAVVCTAAAAAGAGLRLLGGRFFGRLE